jgi:hypothetical protein
MPSSQNKVILYLRVPQINRKTLSCPIEIVYQNNWMFVHLIRVFKLKHLLP